MSADKGRTTVFIGTDKYKDKILQLQGNDAHEVLKKDPTEDYKNNLKALLKPLLNENMIVKPSHSHPVPTANFIPKIFSTPRIHKPRTLLRLIVDRIGYTT